LAELRPGGQPPLAADHGRDADELVRRPFACLGKLVERAGKLRPHASPRGGDSGGSAASHGPPPPLEEGARLGRPDRAAPPCAQEVTPFGWETEVEALRTCPRPPRIPVRKRKVTTGFSGPTAPSYSQGRATRRYSTASAGGSARTAPDRCGRSRPRARASRSG